MEKAQQTVFSLVMLLLIGTYSYAQEIEFKVGTYGNDVYYEADSSRIYLDSTLHKNYFSVFKASGITANLFFALGGCNRCLDKSYTLPDRSDTTYIAAGELDGYLGNTILIDTITKAENKKGFIVKCICCSYGQVVKVYQLMPTGTLHKYKLEYLHDEL